MAMSIEDRREKDRIKARERRAKLKALGVKDSRVRVRTEAQKAKAAEDQRRYRDQAKARGEKLPADTWHLRNPERQRERTKAWREANPEKGREYALKWRTNNKERYLQVSRAASNRRRSSPKGKVDCAIFNVLYRGIRAKVNRASKYTMALGYDWKTLRAHLEAQFTPVMTWENWGEVWELDHIKPLSSFQYTSLDGPLFRECWALINLRPLLREENASKGAKPA